MLGHLQNLKKLGNRNSTIRPQTPGEPLKFKIMNKEKRMVTSAKFPLLPKLKPSLSGPRRNTGALYNNWRQIQIKFIHSYTLFPKKIWRSVSMSAGSSPKVGWKWKWPNGVEKWNEHNLNVSIHCCKWWSWWSCSGLSLRPGLALMFWTVFEFFWVALMLFYDSRVTGKLLWKWTEDQILATHCNIKSCRDVIFFKWGE